MRKKICKKNISIIKTNMGNNENKRCGERSTPFRVLLICI
jgi:hypothetical protein